MQAAAARATSRARCTRPPELVRDFIHDCLYNPAEGYFSRIVNIFDGGPPLNFPALRNQEQYTRHLHRLYRAQTKEDDRFYQLWHTPSELFKPWYGRTVANYMLQHHPRGDPLLIYEVGPGNGTLAQGILDHIRAADPALYQRTTYSLVDISALLSAAQRARLAGHAERIRIVNQSILDFSPTEERPAFVLAMEVLDNMPHDRIAYASTGELLQGTVWTNDAETGVAANPGRYQETFEPATDPLIIEYMNLMDRLGIRSPSLRWHPLDLAEPLLGIRSPWRSEFVPTVALQFLRHIARILPRHRLVLSDFSSLPDTVRGYGAPVVQTRYQGDTVACSSYLLQRGLFDIFFPTDFSRLQRVHAAVAAGLPPGRVVSHAAFCRAYGDVAQTRTRSGYNPMLEEFENVQLYLSL